MKRLKLPDISRERLSFNRCATRSTAGASCAVDGFRAGCAPAWPAKRAAAQRAAAASTGPRRLLSLFVTVSPDMPARPQESSQGVMHVFVQKFHSGSILGYSNVAVPP